jgi:aspartyl-tRNA(Asn)/glutamyl-tRNA(Gln) amidotransferase subunit C
MFAPDTRRGAPERGLKTLNIMSLDKATVAHIASLARIDLKDEDLERMAGELSQIITWVEQLSEVDTEGVAPMTSVVEMTLPRRQDVVADGDYPDDILANAPRPAHGFFTVPKVVE